MNDAEAQSLIRSLTSSGVAVADIVRRLKDEKVTFKDCLSAVRAALGIPRSEALRLILSNPAWEDVLAVHNMFLDFLESEQDARGSQDVDRAKNP